MKPTPVIAVFDVGKTNKKLFLFEEDYHIVFERSARFNEIKDEDGFPCENLDSLKLFIFDALNEISSLKQFDLKAVNFSAYGASFVYLDENGQPVAPLYNYLKPYPEELEKQFYVAYGPKEKFSVQTASPALGSLNSGLQLYRIKYRDPGLFKRIKYALHLPQYLSYLLSCQKFSDLTSIGCHTALWDFEHNDYHHWVVKEGINRKLAPIHTADAVVPPILPGSNYPVGTGLHDSSAALIPYLVSFNEPFILISTGTWSISLNPFNQSPLTGYELKNDCLNYIQYNGKPVKASRLFIGHDYDGQVKRIAAHFNQDVMKYKNIGVEEVGEVRKVRKSGSPEEERMKKAGGRGNVFFEERDLSSFSSDIEAYFQLMRDIVDKQKQSTDLVLRNTNVKRIFVDGGFSKNQVFMHLLAEAYPNLELFGATVPQSSALGAALAIHHHWNAKQADNDLITLKRTTV